MRLNRYTLLFICLLIFHTVTLIWVIGDYSISAKEAEIFFNQEYTPLSLLTHFTTNIFGINDYALRIPFILFYMGSAILLYLLTNRYFRSDRDRFICIVIFMLLPGVNSAALLVNESIIVIFGTLLYLYLYKLRKKENYILLFLFVFIDNSFAILFLSLFFFSLYKKDNVLLIISLILFGVSMSLYGFQVDGKPKGYFLDTCAIYATIFSPVLFIYFFYSMYRVGIKWERNLLWYIAITALGLSLLFSLRQKVAINDFAPFVVIAIPIMVKLFIHSLRVRLKEFRTIHYIMLRITLGVLILSFLLFIFNKSFYLFLNNPSSHAINKHYVVKELAEELKKLNIQGVTTPNNKLALRLRFYGIDADNSMVLSEEKVGLNPKEINVFYKDRLIKKYYLLETQ